MRPVSLTISLPWSRTPYITTLHGRTKSDIETRIRQAVDRYARRAGVGVSAVDYEVSWGKAA